MDPNEPLDMKIAEKLARDCLGSCHTTRVGRQLLAALERVRELEADAEKKWTTYDSYIGELQDALIEIRNRGVAIPQIPGFNLFLGG